MILLTAVLVVGVVGLCLWARKPPARMEFVSKVEPFDDYRCRFTASTVWQCHYEPDYGPYYQNHWTFTLPRSPIRQWVESHLLHKDSPSAHTITIFFGGYGGMRMGRVKNGIEYTEVNVYPPEQITSERYFTINNCAATLATTKLGSTLATKMIVTARKGSSFELRLDSSAEVASFPETDREVQAIIAYLHFEMVTDGKQGSSRP